MSVDDTLRSLVGLLVLPLALARPLALTAQSLEGAPVACKGQIISRIEVHTRPPFEITGSKVQQRLARQVTQLHATTNPEIIRRFLALKPGEPCTELRRSESERILRAQPYLADASVQSFAGENGTVSISVRTVDEVSLVLGGGGSGKPPYLRGFRLGESNLMGGAISVVGDWRYSADFHDALALRVADYQLFGKPYQLHLDVARRERGRDWGAEASHPFLTDLQNVSWRTTLGSRDGYRRFRRIDGTSLLLPFERSYGDVGGVVRIGRPGRIALIGASLSSERDVPGATPLLMDPDKRLSPAPNDALSGRYDSHRATRINALIGVRDVSFIQVSGFESLDGLQDMRKGVEIASLFGKGLNAFDGGEHDMIVSTDAYTGFGTPRAFGAIEVLAEGRKPDRSDDWDGLLASGRAAVYVKPQRRQTILGSAEWSGGWRMRTPFQLALAERGGGPLGYRHSWLAGGRRLVMRLEDRVVVGQLKQFMSLGVAPFVNTGQLWAGDAPFGSNTGVKVSTGISLLASVPPGSQRLWRLDLAFPLHPDYGAKRWELHLMSVNFTRVFWKEPTDVGRNRERAIPTSIFNWP